MLARALLLVLSAAVVAGCGSGGATRADAQAAAAGPDPAAVAAFQQALTSLDRGDTAAAEAGLQGLADEHPDYAGPLVNLAIIRAGRDEPAALALLERAVAVCEHCAAPWTELGVMQRRQGRFAEAEQSYLKAIAADSGYANAWFNLGVLYELYLQRPELALDNYQRFRELHAADAATGEVDKWIADLRRRTGAVEQTARAGELP
jgi:tetratricopeptide (TPR) repeat protein